MQKWLYWIRLVGSLIYTVTLATNITYASYSKFVSQEVYEIYVIFLKFRPCLIGTFVIYYAIDQIIVYIRNSQNKKNLIKVNV